MPSAEAPLPAVEQGMAPSPEAAGNRAQPAILPLPADDAAQLPASVLAQAIPTVPAQPQIPSQAANTRDDILTKEMVQKAKRIALQTASDPYEQNKQLALAKAEYLKKKYGKDIKVAA